MDTTTQVPTVWNQLAETMYLKDSPTAEVWMSERASFRFGRFQSSEGLPDVARPVVGERGYIVALQLKAIPFIEQFLGNKKVSSGSYPIGAVSAIDLQDEPGVFLPNPFDALVLYVTQAALDEVAYAHRAPRVEQLVWPLGKFDPVVYHLGKTLLASLERTPSHFQDFPGPCLACLELSFCLLLWRCDTIGSAVSGWTLFSADAKGNRVIGGSSGWQYRPPAGCGSM